MSTTMETRLRVLLIDDSAEDATLLVRWLKRAGYTPMAERVETAGGMKEALLRGPWDVILSDNRMPLFSASGALCVLRELGLDVPLIIVSGMMSEEMVAAARRDGASDYIFKDDLSGLAPALDRALQGAAQRLKHHPGQAGQEEDAGGPLSGPRGDKQGGP